jgi:hypothetical protein
LAVIGCERNWLALKPVGKGPISTQKLTARKFDTLFPPFEELLDRPGAVKGAPTAGASKERPAVTSVRPFDCYCRETERNVALCPVCQNCYHRQSLNHRNQPNNRSGPTPQPASAFGTALRR